MPYCRRSSHGKCCRLVGRPGHGVHFVHWCGSGARARRNDMDVDRQLVLSHRRYAHHHGWRTSRAFQGPPFFVAPPAYPNDLYAYTREPYGVDLASVTRVRDAVLGNAKLDYLLAGHSHFDHTWDTPTWAKLTGAPMIGGVSSCFQALAQGVAGNAVSQR